MLVDENHAITFNTVQFEEYILTTEFKNKWFMTKSKIILSLLFAFCNEDGKIIIVGEPVSSLKNLFTKPINSSHLDIYVVKNWQETSKMRIECSVDNIECKMICLEEDAEMVFIPLLHTKK